MAELLPTLLSLYSHALCFLTAATRTTAPPLPAALRCLSAHLRSLFHPGNSSVASEPHQICSLHGTRCECLAANWLHNHRVTSRRPCQAALTAGLSSPAQPVTCRYLKCPLFQVTHSEAFWPNSRAGCCPSLCVGLMLRSCRKASSSSSLAQAALCRPQRQGEQLPAVSSSYTGNTGLSMHYIIHALQEGN